MRAKLTFSLVVFFSFFNSTIYSQSVGIGSSSFVPGAMLEIHGSGNTNATQALHVENSAGTDMLTVLNNGNVGIGTATPSYPLHIVNTTNETLTVESDNTTSTAISVKNTSAGGHDFQFYSTGSGNLAGRFGVWDNTAGKTWLNLSGTNGDYTIVSGAVYGFSSSATQAGTAADVGISRTAAGSMAVGNGTAADYSGKLFAGNVGVGTNSTSYHLEVNGGTGKGRIYGDVSGVNPALILSGDATNGYYPYIEFRPLGSTAVGGNIQSNSSSGGISLQPYAGPVRVIPSAVYTSTYGVMQLESRFGQTADLYQMRDYTNNYVLGGMKPISATNQRIKFSLYNTLESAATNYEAISLYPDNTNNVFRIEAENGGTGTLRNLVFQGGGGNVGIGTTSATSKLTVLTSTGLDGISSSDGTRWIKLMSGTLGAGSYNGIVQANDNAIIYSSGTIGNGAFVIAPWSGSTSGLRMDGNGYVGIGTTTPGYLLHLEYTNTGTTIQTASAPVVIRNNTTTSGALSLIRFVGSTSAGAAYPTAYIGTYNTPGAGLASGAIFFAPVTTAGNLAEAMRITANGNVGIGTTNPGVRRLDVVSSSGSGSTVNASQFAMSLQFGGGGTEYGIAFAPKTANPVNMYFCHTDGTTVGSITSTNAATAFNTTSDIRLKQNIKPTQKGLNDLMKAKVCDYTFKNDSLNKIHTGFIAQELYQIYPEAVTKPHNENDFWQVDYGKITPLLVKAIQEQQAEIDELKAQIQKLQTSSGAQSKLKSTVTSSK